MCKLIDLTGKRFGRVTVLEKAPTPEKMWYCTAAFWKCRCDCGKEFVTVGYSLRNGGTRSCGCLSKEMLTKHGLSKTPLYTKWRPMLCRCKKKGLPCYEAWDDFVVFKKWAETHGYVDGCILKRIDHSKGLMPGNLKFVKQEGSADVR